MIRDVVQNAGLEGFAELGLVMFVTAFLLVLTRVYFMTPQEAEEQASIPLSEES
jgi:hypothetical protein